MIAPGEVTLATLLDVVRDGRVVCVVACRSTTTRHADTGAPLDLTPAETAELESRLVVAERLERDRMAAEKARAS